MVHIVPLRLMMSGTKESRRLFQLHRTPRNLVTRTLTTEELLTMAMIIRVVPIIFDNNTPTHDIEQKNCSINTANDNQITPNERAEAPGTKHV